MTEDSEQKETPPGLRDSEGCWNCRNGGYDHHSSICKRFKHAFDPQEICDVYDLEP